jgi:tetratricopeptide (TPR) repeat protein
MAASKAARMNTPTVPDYDLLQRIGVGAYGEVWLARSNATGARRAAKIVWRNRFQDERPFRREFEGIQRFEQISREHPSQLALFHIGRKDAEGYFYYVMELADDLSAAGRVESAELPSGRNVLMPPPQPEDSRPYQARTLRAELEHGRLPAAQVLEIGLVLTEALSHLHQHGLVHRDVKPSNVIFVNGRPKLADIGLVTDASDQCSIVGTEGYLPPEGTGKPQADIFALGKVLYEAATGMDRREFPKLPEDLRLWPDYQGVVELNEITLRACAKEPARRYPSCEEMRFDLEVLARGKSVRLRRKREAILATCRKVVFSAVVLCALAAVARLAWRRPAEPGPLSQKSKALQLYAEARNAAQNGNYEDLLAAYFKLAEAVKLDPEFVDAYYAMSESYFGGPGVRLPPFSNSLDNVKYVAEKLKNIGPRTAQYHVVNSWLLFLDWKFEQAIDEADKAIRADPHFLRAHGLKGFYLLLGRADVSEARREYEIAESINPYDFIIQSNLGETDYVDRKFGPAIKQYCVATNMRPQAVTPYWALARAYEADGQYDAALDAYKQWESLLGGDPEKVKLWYAKLRAALRDGGREGMWKTRLEGAQDDPRASPYYKACLYARLGRTNDAFAALDTAYDKHDGLFDLLRDDCWDPYRGNPKFQEVVKRVDLHPNPEWNRMRMGR